MFAGTAPQLSSLQRHHVKLVHSAKLQGGTYSTQCHAYRWHSLAGAIDTIVAAIALLAYFIVIRAVQAVLKEEESGSSGCSQRA